MVREQFLLTQDVFSEVTEQIHNELLKTKANKKEVLRADLLLEETFMRMTEIGKVENVTVSIRNRLGELTLRLEAEGVRNIIRSLKSLTLMKMTRTITAR